MCFACQFIKRPFFYQKSEVQDLNECKIYEVKHCENDKTKRLDSCYFKVTCCFSDSLPLLKNFPHRNDPLVQLIAALCRAYLRAGKSNSLGRIMCQ